MQPSFNPILEKIVVGDYAGAWSHYAAMEDPTLEDDRWAGLSLYNLQKFLSAKDLLLSAYRHGCTGAGIELSMAYRQLGESGLSVEVLEEIDLDTLPGFDRALAEREWGSMYYSQGSLGKAAEAFERALAEASAIREGQYLLPAIAQALGLTHSARGHDRRAIHYLDRALQVANPARRVYIEYNRVLCNTYLGRYEEARQDLESARENLTAAPAATALVDYAGATLERARGYFQRAIELYRAAAYKAKSGDEPETECYALLGSCAAEVATDDIRQARGQLARARSLVLNRKMEAHVALREGAMLARQQEPRSGPVLEQAVAIFADLHLEREAGWATLHLAEACLRLGMTQSANEALERATDLRHALGGGAPLMIELRALPVLFQHLSALPDDHYAHVLLEDWQALEGGAPVTARLVTLGARRLLVDDRPARLDCARAVEILAFVIAHPNCTLEGVQTALFPDQEPKTSKNYFHQARLEVERQVPGLSIHYDKPSRTYAVRSEGPRLEWDVLDLKRAFSDGGEDGLARALDLYRGPFLPDADGEWARAEREDLEWSMVKVGLETIEGWFERGEYRKCLSLAGRLLMIEPLSEPLSEYLVKATAALEGAVAARRLLDREAARFREEVGEVPPGLTSLRQALRDLN